MNSLPPIAILAGGLATRLRDVAGEMPKAMIPVAGRPFIAHQLDRLKAQGISRVVLCVGHRGELIQKFVGDGSAFGLEVVYVYDGDFLRGTGGAIRNALPELGMAFFVTYGDTLLDVPYSEVWQLYKNHPGSRGVMTVLRNDNRWDTSNVRFENSSIVAYDKSHNEGMHHIDYGLSLFDALAFEDWRDTSRFDLSDVIRGLLEKGELLGFEVANRFYEIGTPESLKETGNYLEKGLS